LDFHNPMKTDQMVNFFIGRCIILIRDSLDMDGAASVFNVAEQVGCRRKKGWLESHPFYYSFVT